MGRDRIAASIGDNRRHILNLACEYGGKASGHDNVDFVGLHRAHNLAKLANLAGGTARIECQILASV